MSSSAALPTAVIDAIGVAVATAVASAMAEALPRIMAEAMPQPQPKAGPKPSTKAKRSTKATPKEGPKVARFVETGKLVETRLDSLPKGALFALRANGAQYKVVTPKGSSTVKGYHPKGETYEFDGARTVFAVR